MLQHCLEICLKISTFFFNPKIFCFFFTFFLGAYIFCSFAESLYFAIWFKHVNRYLLNIYLNDVSLMSLSDNSSMSATFCCLLLRYLWFFEIFVGFDMMSDRFFKSGTWTFDCTTQDSESYLILCRNIYKKQGWGVLSHHWQVNMEHAFTIWLLLIQGKQGNILITAG